jgi:hypothetical protein
LLERTRLEALRCERYEVVRKETDRLTEYERHISRGAMQA